MEDFSQPEDFLGINSIWILLHFIYWIRFTNWLIRLPLL